MRSYDKVRQGSVRGGGKQYQRIVFLQLNYRYPRGESYTDVIARLEPVIFELERTKHSIIIIAHQAVMRCLYGYLMNRDPSEVPFIPIPLNTVIQLQPRAYGCVETRFVLDGKTEGSGSAAPQSGD